MGPMSLGFRLLVCGCGGVLTTLLVLMYFESDIDFISRILPSKCSSLVVFSLEV